VAKRLIWLMVTLMLPTGFAVAADYHVATTGSDTTGTGAPESPYATLAKALTLAVAGDTIWMHGGMYTGQRPMYVTQSGTNTAPIRVWAVPGELPVLDFTGETDLEYGWRISGAYWHVKGLKMQHTGKYGIKVYGTGAHHVLLENLVMWANGFTAINVSNGAADNTILNCDAYESYYAPDHGNNGDGFGVKTTVGTGNKLIGCRSWSNSDDGFDFWQANNAVHIENCYAWRNGENIWNDPCFTGNGTGIKLGRDGGAHEVIRCAVWDQVVAGIDLNGNSTGVTVKNCTVVRSQVNYKFTYTNGNADKNVLCNNISYGGTVSIDSRMDQQHNSWNTSGVTITTEDFVNLDPGDLEGSRNVDGSLPTGWPLRLVPGSDGIDSGLEVGLVYSGAAPDFGAFEYGDTNGDNVVNWLDVQRLTTDWLAAGDLTNLDLNGGVNFLDFAVLMQYWTMI
jgi:hypothetical protein